MAQKPCINCKYFDACGNTNRTIPCNGRVTKGEDKRNKKEEKKHESKRFN